MHHTHGLKPKAVLLIVNSGADCSSAAEALAHGGTTGPGEMVRP